ncbi:ankyrin repeat domain-containing protein [Pararhizobium sp. PWRC1-1]|uniref:ankyrin repeat domain-containing protein n=1 Tax=Pararhizobium sp. PWRC1-1 TaxID=2804566 RepID=UPI003CE841E5
MHLEASIWSGDLAAATYLLRAGENPNRIGPDGLTPLMIASGLGQSQMVEILLTARADVLAIEPRMGATALHKAAQSGNTDVIRLLLDHGAFIDQQSPVLGHTPLMDAVLHKHAEAVRYLLERGTRTTIRNHWQQTALELAQLDGLEAITKLIEARDGKDGEHIRAKPLMAAVTRAMSEKFAAYLHRASQSISVCRSREVGTTTIPRSGSRLGKDISILSKRFLMPVPTFAG